MLRLLALATLVVTLALTAATAAGAGHVAAPRRPAATAGFISALKSKVCTFLDGVETLELPVSLTNLVRDGELDASTVILFGANKALCGGGHAEKIFSLAHDWLLGAVTHNLKVSGFDFSGLRLKLPTLVQKLHGLSTLRVSNLATPTVTFSRNPVGADNLVPLTVNWLATPLVGDAVLEARPLSSSTRPYFWTEHQNGLVGTQSAPLGLSSGRWQLCIRADTVFKSRNQCGYPFWITICSTKAAALNRSLAQSADAAVGFYGNQVGVVGDSAYGTATFDVDHVFATSFTSTFNLHDVFGNRERFFAYWAWNLGEGWHTLHAFSRLGPFGSAVAGHVLDVVTISSALARQC